MGKLQGWKDIASHLGKSVRTVQRWERDYQLPAHRLGREGGEIVWADSEELDEWLRSKDPAHLNSEPLVPTPIAPAEHQIESAVAIRGLVRVLLGMLVVAACLGLLAWRFMPPARWTRVGPSDWRIANGGFDALSAKGDVLWSRHFGASLRPETYPRPASGWQGSQVLLADLDNDGLNEVLLMIADRPNGECSGVHILAADGRDRAKPICPTGTVTFGSEIWAGPWFPHRLWVVRENGRPASIYASFIHPNQYPTLLVELDADGRERGRYWSNGYVRHIQHARFRGEPVVLVGATNNDTRGASLAILPRGRLSGAPPAVNPQYHCTSCGNTVPLEFLVFPRRCLARAMAGQSHVQETYVDDAGQILANVTEGPLDAEDVNLAGVWYTLDADLHVRDALITSGMIIEHRNQHTAGAIDHPLGPQDEADLFPVLRWTGSKFEALPPGPVRRQGS